MQRFRLLALPALAGFLVAATPLAKMAAPWPDALDSPAAFDEASRAEIAMGAPSTAAELAFAAALASCAREKRRFCAGLAAARAEIQALPPRYAAWRAASAAFHAAYGQEEARLVALAAKTTSEIVRLDPSELLGPELADKQILLSFDDGPATGTATEELTAFLRREKLNGFFFLVGANLSPRVEQSGAKAVSSWYEGMCLGWHGARHVPHTSLESAGASIDAGKAALSLLGVIEPRFFRPPFGQRSGEVLAHLRFGGWTNVLWNLDSQDWSPQLEAQDVARRVETLILTKRRGIALFHDVHPKARVALPALIARFAGSGVSWMDCRELGKRT